MMRKINNFMDERICQYVLKFSRRYIFVQVQALGGCCYLHLSLADYVLFVLKLSYPTGRGHPAFS